MTKKKFKVQSMPTPKNLLMFWFNIKKLSLKTELKLSQKKKVVFFFYIIYLINKKISLSSFSAFHLSHWVLFDGISFFLKTVELGVD